MKKRDTFLPFALPYITQDEIDGVVETLKSGWLTTGKKTKLFESKFEAYVKTGYAAALNSATGGLFLSLVASGVKKGDNIITTPYTFCATYNVVIENNANLILADVKEEDYNIDPLEIEKRSKNKNIKAVIPVHFAGLPCDMQEILSIAKKKNALVIEDAAHALSARYKGKQIGDISGATGDATVFSFYATKNITTGEGGMVTTRSKSFRDLIAILSLHGISKDAWKRYTATGSWQYDVTHTGYKYNMMDLQAAIGLEQLKKAELLLKMRENIAAAYSRELKNVDGIAVPFTFKDKKSAWHLYVLRINEKVLKINRNVFIEKLKEANIGTSVHFIPAHLHPYYRKRFGFKPSDFPVATKLFNESLSLPIYPGMRPEDISYVTDKVKEIARKYKR